MKPTLQTPKQVKNTYKKCKICRKKIVGRSDKLFCSIRCKNYYHINLRRVTKKVAVAIDKKLHRNRSILLEIMGKRADKKMILRIELENKKFHFSYLTHFHVNSKGKTFHWIYDFAWMSFSTDEILIVREIKKTKK